MHTASGAGRTPASRVAAGSEGRSPAPDFDGVQFERTLAPWNVDAKW